MSCESRYLNVVIFNNILLNYGVSDAGTLGLTHSVIIDIDLRNVPIISRYVRCHFRRSCSELIILVQKHC